MNAVQGDSIMDKKPTVRIAQFGDTAALLMTWAHRVDSRDVHAAFKEIDRRLNESGAANYVVVDLRENPNFPLGATVQAAAFGPYRNPLLEEWLIIGSNPVARTISRILSATTRRSNVRWFDSEAEVHDYLTQKISRPG